MRSMSVTVMCPSAPAPTPMRAKFFKSSQPIAPAPTFENNRECDKNMQASGIKSKQQIILTFYYMQLFSSYFGTKETNACNLSHHQPVNNSKNNTLKGNRERLWCCRIAPAHQQVNTSRKCRLNHSSFLHVASSTPDKIKEKQADYSSAYGVYAPCWSNIKTGLTRKYFCLASFSWNAEPNTAVCPSYRVFCCMEVQEKC